MLAHKVHFVHDDFADVSTFLADFPTKMNNSASHFNIKINLLITVLSKHFLLKLTHFMKVPCFSLSNSCYDEFKW